MKSRKSGSGSEKRQRGVIVNYRTTPERAAALQIAAADRGLTLAAYLREREEGSAGPRLVRRRPLPDEALLRAILLELNRHGVNLNQIARVVNIDGDPYGLDVLRIELSKLYAECRAHIRQAPP